MKKLSNDIRLVNIFFVISFLLIYILFSFYVSYQLRTEQKKSIQKLKKFILNIYNNRNDKMDNTVKVTSIHLIFAIVAALLSSALTIGWFGFTNPVIAALVGIVLLYITGQLCNKIFADDEELKGFTKWLWDGIVPFIFCWFLVWTLLFNYLGLPH